MKFGGLECPCAEYVLSMHSNLLFEVSWPGKFSIPSAGEQLLFLIVNLVLYQGNLCVEDKSGVPWLHCTLLGYQSCHGITKVM